MCVYLMIDIRMLNGCSSRRWLWSECRCLWSIDIIVPIIRHEWGVGNIVHEAIVVGHVGVTVSIIIGHARGMGENLEGKTIKDELLNA